MALELKASTTSIPYRPSAESPRRSRASPVTTERRSARQSRQKVKYVHDDQSPAFQSSRRSVCVAVTDQQSRLEESRGERTVLEVTVPYYDDALADYQFGKKKIHHLFCQSCGVGSFSRGLAPNGDETFAINVNCLDDVDAATLKLMPFDGKNM